MRHITSIWSLVRMQCLVSRVFMPYYLVWRQTKSYLDSRSCPLRTLQAVRTAESEEFRSRWSLPETLLTSLYDSPCIVHLIFNYCGEVGRVKKPIRCCHFVYSVIIKNVASQILQTMSKREVPETQVVPLTLMRQ